MVRKTKVIGNDLGIGGRETLTHGLGSDQKLDFAIRIEPQDSGFRQINAAGRVDVAGQSSAPQLACRRAPLATFRKAAPISGREGAVEECAEVAAVISPTRGISIGDLIAADQIAATNFNCIHAELVGGRVKQAFKTIDDFRSARAAIGAGRNTVGEDAAKSQKDLRDVVNAGYDAVSCRGGNRRTKRRQVSPHVAQNIGVVGENAPIPIKAKSHRSVLIAALCI